VEAEIPLPCSQKAASSPYLEVNETSITI